MRDFTCIHTYTYVSQIQYLSIDSWIWNKPISISDNTHMQETQQNTSVLPVPCQYMFSLMNFIVNNQDNFQTNPSVHSINIRRKYNFYRPNANLSWFQKRAFCGGIIIFNNFLLPLQSLIDKMAQFKVVLRRYINTVGSHFATVRFTTINFYNPCRVGPSTPKLWCITVATQASFLYALLF